MATQASRCGKVGGGQEASHHMCAHNHNIESII